MLMEVFYPFYYLLQQRNGLLLRQLSLLLEVVIEIEIAELGDNVHVVACLEDVVQLDDVAVTHSLHYVDLAVEVL